MDVLYCILLAEADATADVDKYWQQVRKLHECLGVNEEDFSDGIVFARNKVEVEKILRQAGILKQGKD